MERGSQFSFGILTSPKGDSPNNRWSMSPLSLMVGSYATPIIGGSPPGGLNCQDFNNLTQQYNEDGLSHPFLEMVYQRTSHMNPRFWSVASGMVVRRFSDGPIEVTRLVGPVPRVWCRLVSWKPWHLAKMGIEPMKHGNRIQLSDCSVVVQVRQTSNVSNYWDSQKHAQIAGMCFPPTNYAHIEQWHTWIKFVHTSTFRCQTNYRSMIFVETTPRKAHLPLCSSNHLAVAYSVHIRPLMVTRVGFWSLQIYPSCFSVARLCETQAMWGRRLMKCRCVHASGIPSTLPYAFPIWHARVATMDQGPLSLHQAV